MANQTEDAAQTWLRSSRQADNASDNTFCDGSDKTSWSQVLQAHHWLAPLLVFLILAAVEGGTFIATMGPLSVPDPDLHMSGTYALATGQSFNPTQEVKGERLQKIHGDERYLKLGYYRNASIEDQHILSTHRDVLYQRQVTSLNRAARAPVDKTVRSNQYLFILYIPQAIGMKIGMLLHCAPATNVLLARCVNLLLYLLLVGLAIALIPRGRALLVLLGVLPLPVFCASSIMCDAIVLGVATLFIAIALRLYARQREISTTSLAVLCILAIVLMLAKYTYAPLVLLPLAARYALSTKRKIIYLCASIIPAGLIILTWQTCYARIPNPSLYNHNKALLLANPVKTFIRICINVVCETILTIVHDPMSLATAIVIIVAVTAALAFRQLILRRPRIDHDGVLILLCCLAICASLFLIYLSLFLTWMDGNVAKRTLIFGLQPRYLYPLLPLLAALYMPKSAQQRTPAET